jgi:hypothetical protein
MVAASRLVPSRGLLACFRRPAIAGRTDKAVAVGMERRIGTAASAKGTTSTPSTSPSRTLAVQTARLKAQTECKLTGKRVAAARGYKTVQEAKTRYHLGVRLSLLFVSPSFSPLTPEC